MTEIEMAAAAEAMAAAMIEDAGRRLGAVPIGVAAEVFALAALGALASMAAAGGGTPGAVRGLVDNFLPTILDDVFGSAG